MAGEEALLARWVVLERCAQRPLSEREALVAVSVALGLRDGEIAGALCMSTSTVRAHLRRLAEKVPPWANARGRGTIAAWAWVHRRCCARSAWGKLGARRAESQLDVPRQAGSCREGEA